MRLRNADERARRRAREAAVGGVDARLRAEAEVLRQGPAWRERVPVLHGTDGQPFEWNSNRDPLLILDNDRTIYEARKRIERYLVNKLILGDYDDLEAYDLWAKWARASSDLMVYGPRSFRAGRVDEAGLQAQARFLSNARHGWAPLDLDFVLAAPLYGRDQLLKIERQNPSSDERRRELERQVALGDPDALRRLEAERHRAPLTPEEAASAGDPVQQAWTAWQQGYGSLEQYQAARASYFADPSDPTAWRQDASARLYRSHPDTAQSLNTGFVGEESPAGRAITLDAPQAEAVLAAVQAAFKKPLSSVFEYRELGRGTSDLTHAYGAWKKRPTVAQATAIVAAYYRSLGYQTDPRMPGTTSGKKLAHPPLVSPDGMARVVFSRTTLQRQYRSWARGTSQYRDYKKDPADQVGVIALAEALVRRAIRAKDWRANPKPSVEEVQRRLGIEAGPVRRERAVIPPTRCRGFWPCSARPRPRPWSWRARAPPRPRWPGVACWWSSRSRGSARGSGSRAPRSSKC